MKISYWVSNSGRHDKKLREELLELIATKQAVKRSESDWGFGVKLIERNGKFPEIKERVIASI